MKKYLKEENLIRNKNYCTLKQLNIDIKSFGAYSLNNEIEYISNGIPFIRGVNIKNGTVSFNNMIFISETANKLLWKSEIKPEMILLSMSGTIGDVAIASHKWKYPINSNQDIAKIDTGNSLNAYYLYAFLLSKFGQNYLKREARGSVQQHVFLSQIEQFEVPIFSNDFFNLLQEKILYFEEILFLSEKLYSEAETILLQELGLGSRQESNLIPDEVNGSTPVSPTRGIVSSVKTLKESFETSGRIDAEYYQPKYDEIISKIKSKPYKPLNKLVQIKKSIEPGSGAYNTVGIPFIRVSDISKYEITQPEIHLDPYEYNLDNLKPLKDTILFSKDGSIGIAYKVEEDLEIITSSALLHLTVKPEEDILPDYLTSVLNSLTTQMQAERDAGGSIIQHWRIEEIKNVLIPILDKQQQKVIADKIQESFRLRRQSKKLLNATKVAVEMAIEQNEDIAIKYLEKNIKLYTNN